MKSRILWALAALWIAAQTTPSAHAQSLLPFPGIDCPGADAGYPGHGYDLLGYIADGLVVHIQKIFRYSEWYSHDEDWNFVIRAVDVRSCPDGKKMFNRDCKTEREKFVNIFWSAASETWRMAKTAELVALGLNLHLPAADVNAYKASPSSSAFQELGRKMWLLIQSDPDKFGVIPADVQGEVQISTDGNDEEAENGLTKLMRQEAGLAECDAVGGLCGRQALVFGAAVADTGHDDGKPELHPIRALVTASNVDPASSTQDVIYRVRAFADYGKAGDGGSGSIAGYICENWYHNTYGAGGSYYPYVAIPPDVFVMPKKPWTSSGIVYDKTCSSNAVLYFTWSESDEQGWNHFQPNYQKSSCDWFVADPVYRSDGEWRVFGAFGVADVTVGYKYAGQISAKVVRGIPRDAGLKLKGSVLHKSVKAPHTARYWAFMAKATAERVIGSTKTPVDLSHLKWSLPSGVVATSKTDRAILVYVPIAPEKKATLNLYSFPISFSGEYSGSSVSAPAVKVSLPPPDVFVAARDHHLGKGKPLSYIATFRATPGNFAGSPTFAWYKKSQEVATGQKVELTFKDSDIGKRALEIRASDGYERAWSYVPTEVPEVILDAALVKGGSCKEITLSKVEGKASSQAVCLRQTSREIKVCSKVELMPEMTISPNPYDAPAIKDPVFTWLDVQWVVGNGKWKSLPKEQYQVSGDALRVNAPVLEASDWAQLPFFRAQLKAQDFYLRGKTTWIYFSNYQDYGALDSASKCISTTMYSKIPKWEWASRDPVWSEWDPEKDGKLSIRDPFLLARLRLFQVPGSDMGVFGTAPYRNVSGFGDWQAAHFQKAGGRGAVGVRMTRKIRPEAITLGGIAGVAGNAAARLAAEEPGLRAEVRKKRTTFGYKLGTAIDSVHLNDLRKAGAVSVELKPSGRKRVCELPLYLRFRKLQQMLPLLIR